MSKSRLFLLTGGGTGAKVAEALVHACAAGSGPDRLDLLLVDADTANGNVARTRDTISVYDRVRPWGWKLSPEGGAAPTEFFRTEIRAHFLTERVSNTVQGSLLQGAGNDMELLPLLDLLYDQDEQESDHQFGFHARANLGCLVLARHLDERLLHGGARAFINEIKQALQAAPTGEVVRVVVAGSIFGGTGASLLPVVTACLRRALATAGLGPGLEDKLRFGAVVMMPYFHPANRLDVVEPQRFLLDTSLALQYYGLTDFAGANNFHFLYLVGSDQPARDGHQLATSVAGGPDQANAAFAEEWVGALSALHFGAADPARLDAAAANRVWIYEPKRFPVTWEQLPSRAAGGEQMTRQMTQLLHTAAFFLRVPRENSGPLSAGLHRLLNDHGDREMRGFEWFGTLLHTWGMEHQPTYAGAVSHKHDLWRQLRTELGDHSVSGLQTYLGEYFARLLFWAQGAFQGPDLDLLEEPDAAESRRDYARLYSAMCDVRPEEIQQDGRLDHYAKDNVLARLVRAAMVALSRDGATRYSARPLGDPVDLRRQRDSTLRAAVPLASFAEVGLAAEQLGFRGLRDTYFRTSPRPVVAPSGGAQAVRR